LGGKSSAITWIVDSVISGFFKMDDIDTVLLQMGKLLHAWQRIESGLFYVYVARERARSNFRLLATTFHHIRSFETKLSLTDKTLSDNLPTEKYEEWRKGLHKELSSASQTRNNIVHGALTHRQDNSVVIAPFMTDLRRHEPASFSYDLDFLRSTEQDWITLGRELIRFHYEIEIDPAP
jgi:hypothetical protein